MQKAFKAGIEPATWFPTSEKEASLTTVPSTHYMQHYVHPIMALKYFFQHA
jgi:hypothetical protein